MICFFLTECIVLRLHEGRVKRALTPPKYYLASMVHEQGQENDDRQRYSNQP